MGWFRTGLLCAATAATLAIPAQAEEVRLTPTANTSWIVDYARGKCRLARYFGEEDDRYLLMFDQFQPGTYATLTVAGREMWRYVGRDNVELTLSPLFSAREVRAEAVSFGDFRSAVHVRLEVAPEQEAKGESAGYEVEGLPHIDTSRLQGNAELSFSKRNRAITFALPELAAAFNALNTCSRDLVSSWGLDLKSQDRMRRQAEPINLREIAERIQQQYPLQALHAREQASLALRIIVDADGSIEECSVNEITSTRYLHSPACDVFGDRAMFVPAQDEHGEPIKSYYATAIVYRIDARR
ncbi:conserved hypothetical protein [Altererythrobacter sp. B11]|uniref:energy transducer TonB n=1 Tax=Altererythrobacter sp. B11 TaxID=2060312 RepID=UPI000DC73056|nr:energy transducer TonB [Altererythrobacter sp. B11]BBC71386.1 conserved hypothetical protein [Altererythrobacter sp. B11]